MKLPLIDLHKTRNNIFQDNNKAIIENVYKPIQLNSNKIQILTYNTL